MEEDADVDVAEQVFHSGNFTKRNFKLLLRLRMLLSPQLPPVASALTPSSPQSTRLSTACEHRLRWQRSPSIEGTRLDLSTAKLSSVAGSSGPHFSECLLDDRDAKRMRRQPGRASVTSIRACRADRQFVEKRPPQILATRTYERRTIAESRDRTQFAHRSHPFETPTSGRQPTPNRILHSPPKEKQRRFWRSIVSLHSFSPSLSRPLAQAVPSFVYQAKAHPKRMKK